MDTCDRGTHRSRPVFTENEKNQKIQPIRCHRVAFDSHTFLDRCDFFILTMDKDGDYFGSFKIIGEGKGREGAFPSQKGINLRGGTIRFIQINI